MRIAPTSPSAVTSTTTTEFPGAATSSRLWIQRNENRCGGSTSRTVTGTTLASGSSPVAEDELTDDARHRLDGDVVGPPLP